MASRSGHCLLIGSWQASGRRSERRIWPSCLHSKRRFWRGNRTRSRGTVDPQRSRRAEGPSAAHRTVAVRIWRRAALSRRAALKAARRRQREKRRGVRGRGGLVAFIRAVMLPGRGSSCADATTTLTAATAAGERTARRFSGLPTRRRDARRLLDVWPSGPQRTVPAPDPAGSRRGSRAGVPRVAAADAVRPPIERRDRAGTTAARQDDRYLSQDDRYVRLRSA